MPEADILRTGVAGLDELFLGGIPRGNVVIVTGAPGTGKTILGLEFIYHGAREFGEPGIVVTFEVSSQKLVGTRRSSAGICTRWSRLALSGSSRRRKTSSSTKFWSPRACF